MTPVEATHGLHIFVGPTRSGKSLLSHHFAYQFVGKICKECPPGRPSRCHELGGLPYVVLTNERSEKVMKWARRWTTFSDLDVPGAHVVALVDEGYLISDARRSQSGLNMEMTGLVAQAGKDGCRLYYTSQTLRKADVRLREDAKYFWDCWNADGMGNRVSAILTTGADGRLPRWLRDRVPPRIMHFDTSKTKYLYDSWEKIDEYAVQRQARQEIPVSVQNGRVARIPIANLAVFAMESMLGSGEGIEDEHYLPAREITRRVNDAVYARPPVSEEEVIAALMRQHHVPDGDRRFWVPPYESGEPQESAAAHAKAVT